MKILKKMRKYIGPKDEIALPTTCKTLKVGVHNQARHARCQTKSRHCDALCACLMSRSRALGFYFHKIKKNHDTIVGILHACFLFFNVEHSPICCARIFWKAVLSFWHLLAYRHVQYLPAARQSHIESSPALGHISTAADQFQ